MYEQQSFGFNHGHNRLNPKYSISFTDTGDFSGRTTRSSSKAQGTPGGLDKIKGIMWDILPLNTTGYYKCAWALF